MTDKYINLADRIGEGAEYSNTTSFCLGIKCALRWLDDHPDQVPGRTLTRSDMVEAFGEEYAGWATRRLARVGYTVAPNPDPEPEFDSETAKALTAAVWGLPLPSEAGETGRAIARELKKAGKTIVTAPGGDNESDDHV